MLTVIKLSDLIEPPEKLSRAQVVELCQSVFQADTYNVSDDGVIDLHDAWYNEDYFQRAFVKHQRLRVQFGKISSADIAPTFDASNLFTLHGSPNTCITYVANSDYLYDLSGGPEDVMNMHVVAHNLKSLKGAPKHSTFFSVSSSSLKSVEGLEKANWLSLKECSSFENTNGFDKITADSITLPESVVQITDRPNVKRVRTHTCNGLARLMLIKGLEKISLNSPSVNVLGRREHIKQLDFHTMLEKLFDDVITESESPRLRYLTIQQHLLDMDMGHYV